MRARYLLTAEKMATPRLKLLAQNSVLPSSVQRRRTSSVVLQPAGAAGHHLDAGFEGAQVVAVGGLRVGKLYGDVGAPEGFRVEILLVVQVDDAHDFMSTAAGDAFYLLAHFAFHCGLMVDLLLFVAKVVFFLQEEIGFLIF